MISKNIDWGKDQMSVLNQCSLAKKIQQKAVDLSSLNATSVIIMYLAYMNFSGSTS